MFPHIQRIPKISFLINLIKLIMFLNVNNSLSRDLRSNKLWVYYRQHTLLIQSKRERERERERESPHSQTLTSHQLNEHTSYKIYVPNGQADLAYCNVVHFKLTRCVRIITKISCHVVNFVSNTHQVNSKFTTWQYLCVTRQAWLFRWAFKRRYNAWAPVKREVQ